MSDFSKKSLGVRVLNYSALAAAGILVAPANAGVIVSGLGFPFTVAPGQVVPVNLTGLGSAFQFNGHIKTSMSCCYVSQVLQAGPAGFVQSQLDVLATNDDPRRLGNGYFIGASRPWHYVSTLSTTGQDLGGSSGEWNGTGPVRGFLGFRVFSGSGYNYGYFDVSYDNSPTGFGTITVHGWAYESDLGVGITTPEAVPEPGTTATLGLGLLALGAAGIRAKRARAKTAG